MLHVPNHIQGPFDLLFDLFRLLIIELKKGMLIKEKFSFKFFVHEIKSTN